MPLEPYDLLRLEGEDLLGEALIAGEDPDVLAITEGGAAATAYARLQFEDVDEVGNSPLEPKAVEVEFFLMEEVLHEKVKIH